MFSNKFTITVYYLQACVNHAILELVQGLYKLQKGQTIKLSLEHFTKSAELHNTEEVLRYVQKKGLLLEKDFPHNVSVFNLNSLCFLLSVVCFWLAIIIVDIMYNPMQTTKGDRIRILDFHRVWGRKHILRATSQGPILGRS